MAATFIRALRHRNYQLFFGGQLISLIGTWMDTVAEAWLVYRLTGSAVLLGTVGFASQIPVFLLAPVGGVVADRFDRRRIIIVTQFLSMILAGTLAALTLTGRVQVWHVVVLAALLGMVNAFDIPARQAFVPELVGREDLMNAIALNSSMFNGARVVGPAIAGILVAAVGEGWCFAINSASYIAVIVGLLMIKAPARAPVATPRSVLAHSLEGLKWVAQTGPVRSILLLLGLASLMGRPYSVLMPIIADQLHGGAKALGLLMGAAGIGALAGALLLATRTTVRGLGRWVAVAAGGFGVALIAFSLARSLLVAELLLLPVGLGMMVQMASSNTLIQSMVPDELRGRVMAAYSMMFMGMAPLGSLLAGFLAKRLGAAETIAFGGVWCVVGAGVFAWRMPRYRGEARHLIVTQQAAAGLPASGITRTGP